MSSDLSNILISDTSLPLDVINVIYNDHKRLFPDSKYNQRLEQMLNIYKISYISQSKHQSPIISLSTQQDEYDLHVKAGLCAATTSTHKLCTNPTLRDHYNNVTSKWCSLHNKVQDKRIFNILSQYKNYKRQCEVVGCTNDVYMDKLYCLKCLDINRCYNI